jgi:predicted transcriptional regulator
MSTENEVFRKIKEISVRAVQPRPSVSVHELAQEMSVTRESLMPSLTQLKQLRLLNFNDAQGSSIKLTLLGTVVKRDKL